MERRQQERLVGAIVVVALASVAVPWLLDGSPEALLRDGQSTVGDVETRIVTVDFGNPDERPTIEAPAPPVVVPVPRGERNEGDEQPSDDAAVGTSTSTVASNALEPSAGRSATSPERETSSSPAPVARGANGQSDGEKRASNNRGPAPAEENTDSVVVAGWAVQVGSFRSRENAQGLADRLSASGYRAFLSRHTRGGQIWYRVRVGTELTRGAAEEIQARLRRDGQSTAIVRHP